MEKLNMTYTHSYGVIRRMREKGLIEDIKKTDITGSFNAKQYRLLMDPVEFLKRRTSEQPIATTTPNFF
jgi:adenylosuccinate lyase